MPLETAALLQRSAVDSRTVLEHRAALMHYGGVRGSRMR